MTTGPESSRAGPVVAWYSASYGYGDDLMYFGPIFRELRRRFDGMLVPVRDDFPVSRFPDAGLLPIVQVLSLRALARQVNGTAYSVPGPKIPTLTTLWRLWRRRADVHIAIEFTPMALVGIALALVKRRPLVLLLEAHPRFRGVQKSPAPVRLLKRMAASVATVALVSNHEAESYATQDLRIDASRVIRAPYLTSVPDVVPRPRPDRDTARRILFLNSLTARKGCAQLLEAVASLPATLRDRITLHVVGDGPELSRCVDLAERLDLTRTVRFLGAIEYADIGRQYAWADVVVCPTLGDYRSLGPVEAVASGKPAIVSRFDGGGLEMVEAAPGAVVLIDPTDLDEFSRSLADLMDTDVYGQALGAARDAAPRFAVQQIADNLEQAIHRAVDSYGQANRFHLFRQALVTFR